MIRFELSSVAQGNPNLVGATLAAKHLKELEERVSQAAGQGGLPEIVLVDFRRIESATGSYLKGLVLPPLRGCSGPDLPALGYLLVTALNPEVRLELRDVLQLTKMTCLEAELVAAGSVVRARVLGNLDPALLDTLSRVVSARTATATQLHGAGGTPISVTAWNNRLSDLHARCLLRRHRAGKQWIYASLVEEINHG